MDSLEHFIDEAISDFPNGMKSHIHTVVDIALELSKIHGANTNEVYLSAKGHDICRLTPPEKLLELAYDFDLPVCDIEIEIPMLLHGPVGAKILSQHMESFNESIYEAVFWHTTGNYGLNDVGKIVFLADKLDPGKNTRYPYQRLLHDLASKNLGNAMKEFLDREIISLVNQGNLVHPQMLTSRNLFSKN